MTRWARMNWPSADRVTSTRLSSSSRVSMTEMMVVLWLFHFRQNSWPAGPAPTTAPLAMLHSVPGGGELGGGA